MESRPIASVLSAGALAGLLAGLAAGTLDAVWSWAPAAQFVSTVSGRLRFVAFTAAIHGSVGIVAGLAVTAALLVLARATRLGDLVRFAFAEHAARRQRDPRESVVGLSLVIAGAPVVAACLILAYRMAILFLANRHSIPLEVSAAMTATLAAVAVAVPLSFVVARPIELALRAIVPALPSLSSVWAPFVAAGVLVALGGSAWVVAEWATVHLLHLRGVAVAILGLVLSIPAAVIARRMADRFARMSAWVRRGLWIASAIALPSIVLAAGSSGSVMKAEIAYTGLGGPIARALRTAFDRDRDGYSRFLGGGDCDDHNRNIHPGAPEIAGDGIDQNCIGGDAANAHHSPTDVGFIPLPATVAPNLNLLLITIDTVRADHLGAYGYAKPTSPHLDKLAADATVFEAAWAHAPSTRYSMPAILTGRLPLEVFYDMSTWWPGLAQKATTIAESLAPLGYVTGAITNYDYFDSSRHMDQGFAEYDNENRRLHGGVAGAGPERTRGSSSKQQTDKAIGFIDNLGSAEVRSTPDEGVRSWIDRHATERFFLWVHYYDPHADYEPHAEVPSFGDDDIARYDGEIRYTDLHLGRLFDALKAKGLYDKTAVVITGDHGEGFGEHGVTRHGYHLYAAQTKVPLIIRIPGLAPRRTTTPAGHIDILPTLVNLAGGQPSDDMMGRSLLDVVAGADRPGIVFQQLSYENNHEMRGGADARCHVIYNVSPETSWEVYRIDRDPLETIDLADDPDSGCGPTRSAIERWYDTSVATKRASP